MARLPASSVPRHKLIPGGELEGLIYPTCIDQLIVRRRAIDPLYRGAES